MSNPMHLLPITTGNRIADNLDLASGDGRRGQHLSDPSITIADNDVHHDRGSK